MSSYEKDSKPTNILDNKKFLIGIIVLLLVVNGVTLFLYYQDRQELGTELQASSTELEETRNKLESISNELDLKIEEIQKLGGDVDTLRLLRETLEKEKEQLVNARDVDRKRIAQINARVEGYRELLLKKDEEIAHLQAMNTELMDQNTSLKQETRQLNESLNEVEQKTQKLTETVQVASRLKAENIRVIGLNSRDKGKERDQYRSNQLEKLQVQFNIAKNDVAPIGGHKIMVRVIEPDGGVIFDVAKGSGTFMLNGKEAFYTAQHEILFDNTMQEISFLYEKGSDYAEGKHKVEIYADEYMIGSTDFVVK
jgi:uncharacterized coiled-coil DUF342 family protein